MTISLFCLLVAIWKNTLISTVQWRLKGSASQINKNCSNSIKFCNSKMGGVDLMDQLKSAYQLDQRSRFRFYLCLFFYLFDVALVISFLVYKDNKELNKIFNKIQGWITKNLKIFIASKLIGPFLSQKF